jgi:signal transduction histidine kinase
MSKNRLVMPTNLSPRPRVNEVKPLRASDIALSILFAMFVALSFALSASGISILGADVSGVLFLLIALVYRGSTRSWWFFYAPIGLLLLFAPVARWESIGVVNLTGLLRASIIPGLSFIGACLIATVRESVQLSIEGSEELRILRVRGVLRVREVKEMGNDMKNILESLTKSIPAAPMFVAAGETPLIETSWNTVEFSSSDAMSAHVESETLSYVVLQQLLSVEMERVAKDASNQRRAKLHLTSPNDVTIPLAVRGSRDAFSTLVQGLIEYAMDSLNGPEGIVRVVLKPGLRSVSILFEDNGRGLNEALILKLEAKGLVSRPDARLSWRELRSLAEANGWKLDLQARLGVGSRVTLDFPRVDAFVYGARVAYTRELKAPSVADSISRPIDLGSRPG